MIFFFSLSLSLCYTQLIEQSSILERTQEGQGGKEEGENENEAMLADILERSFRCTGIRTNTAIE